MFANVFVKREISRRLWAAGVSIPAHVQRSHRFARSLYWFGQI